MKIRHLIGMVIIIVLTIHFAAGGLVGSQSKKSAQGIAIEKIAASGNLQDTIKASEQISPARSIYSKSTIISLIVAVMGIVAFRRNTYS